MAGETLLPKEAVRLLPSREQFVRLWRMLERTVPKEGVQTPYLPYIRALAEELPGAEPFLRAAFCLEIFRERGLVSLARSCVLRAGTGKYHWRSPPICRRCSGRSTQPIQEVIRNDRTGEF